MVSILVHSGDEVEQAELSHPIDDDYLMTHILACLAQEYSTVVDHAKIDWRSKTLTLIELKKRLKKKYMQLHKENGWAEDEMALSASQNSARNQKEGSNQRKTTKFKDRCCHCGKFGHKKVDCRDWSKLSKEEQEKADKESQKRSQRKAKSILNAFIVIRWDTMQVNAQKRSQRIPVGGPVAALQ